MLGSKRSSASACSLSLVVVFAAPALSCKRPPPEEAPVNEAATIASTPPSADAVVPGADAQAPAAEKPDAAGEKLQPYLTGEPAGGRSIGNTSLVFKLKLDNGAEAAFKPRSKKPLGAFRYKGEIAAYRLARALGLPNVPAAVARSFVASKIRSVLKPKDADAWDRFAMPDADGKVRGALIPWLPEFRFFEIESEPDFSRWRDWLMVRNSEIPEAVMLGKRNNPSSYAGPVPARLVAQQLSILIVFDYLTANWDRWSGGNIGYDKSLEMVLFVDNDGAFYDAPDVAKLNEQLDAITKMHRFSRDFVKRLQGLDAKKLEEALGEEAPGTPLLAPKVIAGVEERRQKVLGILSGKIAADGEPSVLYFE